MGIQKSLDGRGHTRHRNPYTVKRWKSDYWRCARCGTIAEAEGQVSLRTLRWFGQRSQDERIGKSGGCRFNGYLLRQEGANGTVVGRKGMGFPKGWAFLTHMQCDSLCTGDTKEACCIMRMGQSEEAYQQIQEREY